MRWCGLLFAALFMVVLVGVGRAEVEAPELYHMVRLAAPTEAQIWQLKGAGLPMEDGKLWKEGYLDIPLSESELRIVDGYDIPYEILQRDLAGFYAQRYLRELDEGLTPKERTDPVHMKYGSMGGFYTFDEIVVDLDSMYLLYPNICTVKDSVGVGWDGNILWMVKISDNPTLNEDEPEAILDALHHAREPGAYASIMYFMWWLLENYGLDDEATHLVNNRELYFVPCVNPDGLLYNELTNPNGGGMWRKNRRDNGGSYGVDLNRNYGYMWGYDNIGSSPTPSSSTYRGPYAFSEPEAQAMRDFVNAHDFKTGVTVHTYGNHYLYAYGYANVPPESLAVHQEYGGEISRDNGYNYGYCYQILYASNGRVQDWQLHEHMIINIEPEIGGDGFWPPTYQIFPEMRENKHCYAWISWCCGAKINVESAAPVGALEPGSNCQLEVSLKNRGMGDSQTTVTGTLTTDSPYIIPHDMTSDFGVFAAREIHNNSADRFAFGISPIAPQGAMVRFGLEVEYEGYTDIDSFQVQIGTPVVVFEDDAEGGTGNWNMGNWGLTTSYFHSATHSFTDSPYGNYSNNQTNRMTLQGTIDVSSVQTPVLKFWTRFEIESSWDFGQVEASSNGGATWIPLEGNYTEPGTGQGVQPTGEPGYDGFQTTWVEESMPLTAFAGISNLKIRFELRSDGGVVEDGWYVDDIQVVGFQEGAPPVITDLIIWLTADGVWLEWTPIPGVDTYHIYRDTQPITNVSMLSVDSTVASPPYYDPNPPTESCRFYCVTFEY
jgi:carboxypeptidase T